MPPYFLYFSMLPWNLCYNTYYFKFSYIYIITMRKEEKSLSSILKNKKYLAPRVKGRSNTMKKNVTDTPTTTVKVTATATELQIEKDGGVITVKLADIVNIPESCRGCPLLIGPCAPNCAHIW